MTKSAVRLLDVAISSSTATRWKWSVCEGPTEIACGYETSREAAHKEGDSALFALLDQPQMTNCPEAIRRLIEIGLKAKK
jgi:hypothetical protein